MPKFRVLAGKHIEGKTPDGRQRVYKTGDVVDSKTDLNKLNSPGAVKFEKVDESTPATPYVGPGGEVVKSRKQLEAEAVQQPQQAQAKTAGPTTAAKTPEHLEPLQTTSTTTLQPLDLMSVKDLVALAQAEEIDLKGATKKDDIVKTLKAAGL